jgi:hypothetical protein
MSGEPAAALLPEGWTSHLDEASGQNFYRNEATQEVQWVPPTAEPSAPVMIQRLPSTDAPQQPIAPPPAPSPAAPPATPATPASPTSHDDVELDVNPASKLVSTPQGQPGLQRQDSETSTGGDLIVQLSDAMKSGTETREFVQICLWATFAFMCIGFFLGFLTGCSAVQAAQIKESGGIDAGGSNVTGYMDNMLPWQVGVAG